MKKSITCLMSCLAVVLVCPTGQAQDVLGGALNAQTNTGASAQSGSNNPIQAGLQGAANAALSGQDARSSIQHGVQGALQNEANRIQGNVQGSIQNNGQAGLNQNGLQGSLQSNGQAGMNTSNSNSQLGTQGNANLQQNFRAQLMDNVQIGADGRLRFQEGSNSELREYGFQPNDQVVDPNGRVVTNAQEIAAIGQRNGQVRVLRNGQMISINTSMPQGGQDPAQNQSHQQDHAQNQMHQQDHAQTQMHRQMSGSVSASVSAKLDKIDQLVREVRAELNASQR